MTEVVGGAASATSPNESPGPPATDSPGTKAASDGPGDTAPGTTSTDGSGLSRPVNEGGATTSIRTKPNLAKIRQSQKNRESRFGSHFYRLLNKRVCVYPVESPKNNTKCCCGLALVEHRTNSDRIRIPAPPSEAKWNYKTHTQSEATDAYGKISFENHVDEASGLYVRVDVETKPAVIYQLLREKWELKPPKLLISITGGAMDFNISPSQELRFRQGLTKLARSTGAWVLTGGTHAGVMRKVGEAIADLPANEQDSIPLIGFATWGAIHNRRDLCKGIREKSDPPLKYKLPLQGEKANMVPLDPNHGYFILVDNGTDGAFGAEMKFRSEVEKFVSEQNISAVNVTESEGATRRKIPAVCIILEGGPNSLNTVMESIKNKVPVVVAGGTGRACNHLLFCKSRITYVEQSDTAGLKTLVPTLSNRDLQTLKEKFIVDYGWSKRPEHEAQAEADKKIQECFQIFQKGNECFLSVFNLDDPLADLDAAALTVLMTSIEGSDEHLRADEALEQLNLAFEWDRPDIAETYIFNRKTNFSTSILHDMLTRAIIGHQSKFVKVLLREINLETYANVVTVELLYKVARKENPLVDETLNLIAAKTKNYTYADAHDHISIMQILHGIEHIVGDLFKIAWLEKDFRYKWECNNREKCDEFDQTTLNDPTFLLFALALLMDQQEMAKIFWFSGKEVLATGMIAIKICEALSKSSIINADHRDELFANQEEFRQMTLEVFQTCYQANEDASLDLLLMPLNSSLNHTLIGLAEMAGHKEFISHPLVQRLIETAWTGGLMNPSNSDAKVLACLLCPFFIPLLKYQDETDEKSIFSRFQTENESQGQDNTLNINYTSRSRSTVATVLNTQDSESEMEPLNMRIETTVSSALHHILPVTNVAAHTDEVIIPEHEGERSVMRMVSGEEGVLQARHRANALGTWAKLQYFFGAPVTNFTLSSLLFVIFLLILTYKVLSLLPSTPDALMYVLAAMMAIMTLGELREMFMSSEMSLFASLHIWAQSKWNLADLVTLVLFWFAFCLQLITRLDELARLLLILDLFILYIRLLYIFLVNRTLGPWVLIVISAIPALINFSIIWLVFMLSFGVVQYATLYPKENADFMNFVGIIFKPYWQTYGELFLEDYLDIINNSTDTACGSGEGPCPYAPEVGLGFLILYMVAGNILLLNLLIAVFNNIYEDIQFKADQLYWCNLLAAVEEYNKPLLPPGLSHIFSFLFRRKKCMTLQSPGGKRINPERRNQLLRFQEQCRDSFLIECEKKEGEDINVRINSLFTRINETHTQSQLTMEQFDLRLRNVDENVLRLIAALEKASIIKSDQGDK